jgi:hypothetical protein
MNWDRITGTAVRDDSTGLADAAGCAREVRTPVTISLPIP